MTKTNDTQQAGYERSTAGAHFHRSVIAAGDKPALVFQNPERILTYRELDTKSDAIAKSLIARGIQKGAHAAIWAPNIPEWPTIFLGCAKAGVALLGVSSSFKAHDLEYSLNLAEVEILFLASGFLRPNEYPEALSELCPELKTSAPGSLAASRLPLLKTVVFIGDEDHPGMYSLPEFLSPGGRIDEQMLHERESSVQPNDRFIFFLTSGTTGRPKIAFWTHEQFLGSAVDISGYLNLVPEDVCCIPPPFFHLFGFMILMASLVSGCSMTTLERFNAQELMKTIEKHHATKIFGTPTMFIAALDELSRAPYDTTSLRGGLISGSVCPPALVRAVTEVLGATGLAVGYGMSEGIVTLGRPEDSLKFRSETIGRPFTGAQMKLISPLTGKEPRQGEAGEMLVKNPFMMSGYYHMPEATAAAIDTEGFFHTGDLGFVDGDGNYHISGRSKDLIIRGGENISPSEIEEILRTHPAVLDAQVVGVPSDYFGEEPVGFIRLKAGAVVTALELKQFCRRNIAIDKVPATFFFVDQYPLTASGKVQKFRLREMAAEKLSEENR